MTRVRQSLALALGVLAVAASAIAAVHPQAGRPWPYPGPIAPGFEAAEFGNGVVGWGPGSNDAHSPDTLLGLFHMAGFAAPAPHARRAMTAGPHPYVTDLITEVMNDSVVGRLHIHNLVAYGMTSGDLAAVADQFYAPAIAGGRGGWAAPARWLLMRVLAARMPNHVLEGEEAAQFHASLLPGGADGAEMGLSPHATHAVHMANLARNPRASSWMATADDVMSGVYNPEGTERTIAHRRNYALLRVSPHYEAYRQWRIYAAQQRRAQRLQQQQNGNRPPSQGPVLVPRR